MNKLLKIVMIAFITTCCRIALQLIMPNSSQTVLKASVFVIKGTLPFAFSLLSLLTYSLLAGLILLVSKVLKKNKIKLKFTLIFCILWSSYLFEPLPHAVSLFWDSFAYVLVDSLALLVMGFLLELFFPENVQPNELVNKKKTHLLSIINCLFPTILFLLGRLALYQVFTIYSAFETQPAKTLLWAFITGSVASCVTLWFSQQAQDSGKFKQPILLGITFYATNLFFFNSFMLLVFDFNLVDLALRTGIDILTISLGLLLTTLIRKNERNLL
ncbi:hypothetical protein M2139_000243 [Enterococcus sp. PF1-24]|uniref:hypothetical protein n=1 Tax=unclassified Enterococcus TaxID=2608891 RepID=UPI0024772629|nr:MULTISPECIES: hypothetical protein [unclassified Enterococcus]MDH6363337.1 hypothetical protein [Enterococcus sp. PFB1-1]MDH6400362.1 hypothetical protein [Enterococcus sp. PF1-24]